ncbi:efflux RND transporter periplasmic adaptor subunit [Candidatus Beckwithbacteria bacterium]|nr:efflux RND transporter periplasmic adaptor subunit [Candidatus Beckwithbacteria bacterium]
MKLPIPKLCKRRWFQFLAILILILGGYFYYQSHRVSQESLKTFTIKPRDLQQTVTASGTVTATNQVSLKFQAGGYITWVGVKEGDQVEQWQAIASVNQDDLAKRLKKSLLTQTSTRNNFEDTIVDYDYGISSVNNYDIQTRGDEDLVIKRALENNQISLDLATLDVEIADLARQYANLYTPIAGIVTKATDEHAGVNASAATTEYVVTDPNSLRFSAEVEELDIASIQVGMPATISLDAFSDEEVKSTVSSISFTPTQTLSGNTAYIAYLPLQSDSRFRLEMNGDVEFLIKEKKNVLAVPIEAVIEKDNKKTVTILLPDNKRQEVEITTGIETDDYYEITKGLSEGSTVILP